MAQNIAVVIDPWNHPFNGTVVSTRRFVQALMNEFDFTLLTTPMPDVHRLRNVQFEKLSIPGVNGIIDGMKVPLARPDRRRLLATLADCDLLHLQFPFFLGWSAVSAANQLGIPVICSFHVQPENLLRNLGIESGILTRILYRLFIARIYNRADLVIAPSGFAAKLLRRHGCTRPIEVVSNGVPEPFFELPLKENSETSFTLLSVGRLAKEKQHEVLLLAIARSQFREKITLHIVGAGPMEERLRRRSQELALDVHITAASDSELINLYQSADLFVHAGEIELEGMSVLEAMASGKVVLISDSLDSAATELIEDPDARFANRNPGDLAAKIDLWLADGRRRALAGANNRELATRRTHRASVDRLSRIYREFPSRVPGIS